MTVQAGILSVVLYCLVVGIFYLYADLSFSL